MARSNSSLLACTIAAAVFAYFVSHSLSFVGTSPTPGLRSAASSVEMGSAPDKFGGYGGSSGGQNYWSKWETGDYYLKPPQGTLQGYEYGRNQLADGRTAGDEITTSSSGLGKEALVLLATVLFFASVYANDGGFFNP
jgi:hypothetical protein